MKLKRWVIVGCLALCALAQAARAPLQYELTVTGTIEIGTDGAVRDYTLKSKLPDAIARSVDKSVRSWRFEPVLVGNKPVIARTQLRMQMQALPVAGGYQLKISDVAFGAPERQGDLRPPSYPSEAIMQGLGARTMLAIRTDQEGNVIEIHPYQTSLTARASDKVAARWRKVFETASMNAARSWKFHSTEQIAGMPVETEFMVPVEFWFSGLGRARAMDNSWRAFVPGPINPPLWMKSQNLLSTGDQGGLKDGETRSLSSRFQLKENVIGKVL